MNMKKYSNNLIKQINYLIKQRKHYQNYKKIFILMHLKQNYCKKLKLMALYKQNPLLFIHQYFV